MRTSRFREDKELVQSHTADKWQERGSNQVSLCHQNWSFPHSAVLFPTHKGRIRDSSDSISTPATPTPLPGYRYGRHGYRYGRHRQLQLCPLNWPVPDYGKLQKLKLQWRHSFRNWRESVFSVHIDIWKAAIRKHNELLFANHFARDKYK